MLVELSAARKSGSSCKDQRGTGLDGDAGSDGRRDSGHVRSTLMDVLWSSRYEGPSLTSAAARD